MQGLSLLLVRVTEGVNGYRGDIVRARLTVQVVGLNSGAGY
jgi:hypothetical protein